MFGIIGRGIVVVITSILLVPVVAFITAIGVVMTLFNGIKDGDWCQEIWEEYYDDMISLFEQAKNIVLNK